jgi:UDP-N-acetylmuramate: L-alanyl-gamma-D-glutamyl-meso-diaminopimelate ligase
VHIHILGICGTFMGSLALLARELGYKVTGSDANVYPPMSTQLEAQGIELMEGYDPEHLNPAPDLVVVGNAMTRGNPAIEFMLDKGMHYVSGPQWLCEHVLQDRWVLAVAGTHGKTTTTSMLAWVLEHAGMMPGYLIGGVPKNFDVSARLGGSPFFVIEADEYDTAFFDKRSKFVHYRPRTLIMNNLEFDHADIFDSLSDIERQFHHVVRTVPNNGQIIYPIGEPALERVIEKGCWTPIQKAAIHKEDAALADWSVNWLKEDGSQFEVCFENQVVGVVDWSQTGAHNVSNALMAIIAARNVGVQPHHAVEALCAFGGVKRRMELIGECNGIRVYDDFAHHPTAIETTLQGLRASVGDGRIMAIIEPRSNTMRLGSHRSGLAASAEQADQVIWYQPPGLDWSLEDVVEGYEQQAVSQSIDQILKEVAVQPEGTHIVVMSNGGFNGIHGKILSVLSGS